MAKNVEKWQLIPSLKRPLLDVEQEMASDASKRSRRRDQRALRDAKVYESADDELLL